MPATDVSIEKAVGQEPPKQNSGRGHGPGSVATPARGARGPKDSASGRGPASALEELMRRKGVDEAWNALEEMQHQGVTTDKYTVSRMLMKTVGDGRARLNPARVYRGIGLVERFIDMQPKDVDEVLFNALLDTCCRLKDLDRLEAIVSRMRELSVTPSPVTLGILVKTYGQAGDLQKVLHVWGEMEKQRGQANAVTYGCMIDACVKCGHLEKALEIFTGMRQAGKHRNTILYTTLIKGYGLEKDLPRALELFREMPQEGVPYNTITYNSILDACVKCGDLGTAESLLREMTAPESQLEPDLITFSTLLKGYCHVGELDKALQVVEAIKARGLRCDELVYNTLMDGCVKANDVAVGVGLFEEMVQSGMRPSAITHSILARLYQRAGYGEDACEAVAQLYQQHGIERPSTGERSRGFGRRPTGSPSSSQPRSQSPPRRSPSAASGASTRTLRRERSDTSDWSISAPSTPGGSLQASPTHHAAPYLPLEALRGFGLPPPESSPFGTAALPPPLPGFGGAASSSPQGPDGAFSLPSPHNMPPVFSLTPTATALPQWPFACTQPPLGLPAAGELAEPPLPPPPQGAAGWLPPAFAVPPPTHEAGCYGTTAAPPQACFEGWQHAGVQLGGCTQMAVAFQVGGNGQRDPRHFMP